MTSLALLDVAELRWASGLMSHLFQVASSCLDIQISPDCTGSIWILHVWAFMNVPQCTWVWSRVFVDWNWCCARSMAPDQGGERIWRKITKSFRSVFDFITRHSDTHSMKQNENVRSAKQVISPTIMNPLLVRLFQCNFFYEIQKFFFQIQSPSVWNKC